MNILFTQHALARLAKRKIPVEWIERVVRNPSHIEAYEVDPGLEHYLGLIPELEGRVLRVILSKSDPRRIITAHLDRAWKGLL